MTADIEQIKRLFIETKEMDKLLGAFTNSILIN